MIASSFLSQQPEDPRNSQGVQNLQRYKGTLESIRNLLMYDVDLRTIRKNDLDMLENDLRGIVKGVNNLRNTTAANNSLNSVDAVQKNINKACDSLYIASDVLALVSTIEGRKQFYAALRDCQDFLLDAIEQFLI